MATDCINAPPVRREDAKIAALQSHPRTAPAPRAEHPPHSQPRAVQSRARSQPVPTCTAPTPPRSRRNRATRRFGVPVTGSRPRAAGCGMRPKMTAPTRRQGAVRRISNKRNRTPSGNRNAQPATLAAAGDKGTPYGYMPYCTAAARYALQAVPRACAPDPFPRTALGQKHRPRPISQTHPPHDGLCSVAVFAHQRTNGPRKLVLSVPLKGFAATDPASESRVAGPATKCLAGCRKIKILTPAPVTLVHTP